MATGPEQLRQRARTATRLAALGAAATLVLGGCGLFGSDDHAAPATTTARPTTTTTTIPPDDPPRIIDAGAAPRTKLRLHLTEGTEASVAFTSDLAVDQVVDGRRQRLDSPPITQVIDYEVGAVDDQGAAVEFRIRSVAVKAKGTGLSEAAVGRLDRSLAVLEGLRGQGHLDLLGRFEDLHFAVPSGVGRQASTQIRSLADQISGAGPTLPTSAVGAGAVWEATTTRPVAGFAVRSTTRYTLTAIDGDRLAYTASQSGSATSQQLELDGLPAGTTAKLVSSDLVGSAKGTMSLASPAFTLRARVSGPQVVSVTSGSTSKRLEQTVDLAFSAVPAAP